MRASRLMALMLMLHSRGRSTAAELARELEVSVRTVYRDVAALQAAGVPLWTEVGPNGGIRLLDGWRTHLDGLTGDEASALFLSGAGAAAAELGLGAVLAAAEAKVLATLPPALRTRAAHVRERFHLDAPGWFQRPEPRELLGPIADAVWSTRRIDMRYRRGDTVVQRRLDPLGLVLKAGVWYLVARHRGDIRTYHVGRVVSIDVRPETFERPRDFDLASWWAESSRAFDQSILRFTCRLRCSPFALRWLPSLVDPAAAQRAIDTASEPDDAGWRVVELRTETEEVAVSQLVGLGAGVEVLEPRSLREAIRDVGAEMAARNA